MGCYWKRCVLGLGFSVQLRQILKRWHLQCGVLWRCGRNVLGHFFIPHTGFIPSSSYPAKKHSLQNSRELFSWGNFRNHELIMNSSYSFQSPHSQLAYLLAWCDPSHCSRWVKLIFMSFSARVAALVHLSSQLVKGAPEVTEWGISSFSMWLSSLTSSWGQGQLFFPRWWPSPWLLMSEWSSSTRLFLYFLRKLSLLWESRL